MSTIGVAVECTVCGHRKQPIGRSAPYDAQMCTHGCEGYDLPPFPGSLWPGETQEECGDE